MHGRAMVHSKVPIFPGRTAPAGETTGDGASSRGLTAAMRLVERAGFLHDRPGRNVIPFPVAEAQANRWRSFTPRPITLLPPAPLPKWWDSRAEADPETDPAKLPRRPFKTRPISLSKLRIPTNRPPRAVSPPDFRRAVYVRRKSLGEWLTEAGHLTAVQLEEALAQQKSSRIRLGDILIRTGVVPEVAVTEALGRMFSMGVARPAETGNLALDRWAAQMPLALAQEFRALPWSRSGGRTVIATSRPERIDTLAERLPPCFGVPLFAVVSERDLDERMHEVHGAAMARAAECLVPENVSCRRLRARSGASVLAIALVGLCLLALAAPVQAVAWSTLLGVVVLILNVGLRASALLALRRDRRRTDRFSSVRCLHPDDPGLPTMTIFVPLHDEPGIAAPLTQRLSRLQYPRSRLDVCIVVEAGDTRTRDALRDADLPAWMRVIPVPDGQPRTKPRAMNYALNFARGEIVGIYDAEDAPMPDQLLRVATRFRNAPPDVACLQGVLDFYNPTRNWMSQCFTIEYANWFRMVLPGLEKLGFLLPLGGTTLFFRRAALERIGAWDAHNVTEDADLGVRLARRGLRTEIIQTTTLEEANASPLAWVKQRSRWMKGYILTWAVHSRHPVALWRDLGAKRFWGFHLQFMGSILNAVLMPLLWSLIVLTFGLWHPILTVIPGETAIPLGLFLIGMTIVNMGLARAGCSAPHHRKLRLWVPTLEAYFPLATLAVAKALTEIVLRPFHWDKTNHGAFGGTDSSEEISTLHNGLAGNLDSRT